MNRRQFNQTMVALGTIATLPVLAYLRDVAAEPDPEPAESLIRIGLVTVGGADGNTVATITQGLPYVTHTIAIDRDVAALSVAKADKSILIGNGDVHPMKSRSAYEMARRQATEIETAISDLDLVFILAGMYGAAGKGMAPVVADVARRKRITTLGIAITPAEWQGAQSNPRVRYGVQELQRAGATVFPINSQHMAQALGEEGAGVNQTIRSLFASISYAINGSYVGIDLHDLQLALNPGGIAAMGFGSADGAGRAENATQLAIAHPLLGVDRLRTATRVIVNIRGKAAGLMLHESKTVARVIRGYQSFDSGYLYSASADESVGDKLIVSILASVPEAPIRPTA